MLVQIAAEAAKRDPQVHFLFVGEGRLRPAIEALVKEAGCCDNVHFLGSRADVPQLMRCMDAFVFPSLYEGLGLVVIEAQAAGLECFVSDNLPHAADIVPDLVRRLALADGPSHWAEQILNALTSSAERRSGHKALSAVEQSNFNIENNVENLLTFYESL
jgi:glycosyltransferase involved in cell wall biosynthesis